MKDVNDNSPEFIKRSFKTKKPVREDVKIGTPVLTLKARDKDSGDFGSIYYKLGPNTPKSIPFSLMRKTGEIRVLEKLDYEKEKVYQFNVISEDGGIPPNTDTATVTIEIENVNDNLPHFTRSEYMVDILEDQSKLVPIITVACEDPDDPMKEDDYEFSITDGNSENCFEMDPYSGTIKLSGCNLDFKKKKEYRLKLQVSDADGGLGFAFLTVRIFDANDNKPK